MIVAPNKQGLEALARLTYNDDFKTMKTWLELELQRISLANDYAKDINDLRRGQGAAVLLRELISIQSTAETVLKKIT